jgi:hypothetical protein
MKLVEVNQEDAMPLLLRSLFAVALIVPATGVASAVAQNVEQPQVVAVEKAPFHIPAFSNELVKLLNVTIPAGRSSRYHKHSTDFAFVIVEAADTKAQALGEAAVDRQTKAGTVSYVGYTKKPGSHQVTNVDTTPYHVVGIEIMYPEPGRFSSSSRVEVPSYKSVLDNARVRGWRLVLDPGQSVPAITQKAPGIRIVVKGGELVESEPGQPDREMSLKLADFFWQEANVTRAVRNTGTTQIELVEFELK